MFYKSYLSILWQDFLLLVFVNVCLLFSSSFLHLNWWTKIWKQLQFKVKQLRESPSPPQVFSPIRNWESHKNMSAYLMSSVGWEDARVRRAAKASSLRCLPATLETSDARRVRSLQGNIYIGMNTQVLITAQIADGNWWYTPWRWFQVW